jgi:hydroxymethylpyrimidine pyrophosphatase-like HAD family hydrolase
VTGRELKDLLRVFPQYELFDRIVAENGALVYRPDTGEEKVLGEPPPMSFIKELQLAGVQPLSVGKVIVATWEPHQLKVLETIKASGTERQMIFNKGAIMILPPGINKATGLQAALREMNLSCHNVVAVGDAENDSHLLQTVECGVAVHNALPVLKQLADWTTAGPHSQGVRELIAQLLQSDLQELDPVLKRHDLPLGRHPDGTRFKIKAYGEAVLLTGRPMSGKTTMAAAFLEELLERQYQFCLIDPEGDYSDYQDSARRGEDRRCGTGAGSSDHHFPPEKPRAKLPGLPGSAIHGERNSFFKGLIGLLRRQQEQLGHPHWLILDEVHHLWPAGQQADPLTLPETFKNFMMLTTSPDLVNPALLRQVDTVMILGEHPGEALTSFARITGRGLPIAAPGEPLKGQALVWSCREDQPAFLVDTLLPAVHLQRHKRKYAKGDLKEHSFYFNGPKGLQLKAKNLADFVQIAGAVDEDTWLYHLQRQDYSNWFGGAIGDPELANATRLIETGEAEPGTSKMAISKLIEENYTGPVE